MSSESDSLRTSLYEILDNLKIDKDNELRSMVKNASAGELKRMFYEYSEALAEVVGDKSMLNSMRFSLPDGSIVGYEEFVKYSNSAPVDAPYAPVKEEVKEEAPQKSFASKKERYVPADSIGPILPRARKRTTRKR